MKRQTTIKSLVTDSFEILELITKSTAEYALRSTVTDNFRFNTLERESVDRDLF